MSISSLYHTQGIRGYNYLKTERTADQEIYYLEPNAQQLSCTKCSSSNTSIVGTGKSRDIRGLFIGLKKR